MLRGRDISRYRADWENMWLIDTHNGYNDVPPIDVNSYPAVKTHLDSYIQSLERRQDKGVTPYNLRNCAYHESLAREKIIWIELVNKSRFAYDANGTFIEATAFMMTGEHIKYLCGFLNSRVANWYILKSAPCSGMGVSRWKKVYVNDIPAVRPSLSTAKEVCGLVDEAMTIPKSDETRLKTVETRIDEIFYELYGISEEELKILERSTSD